MGPPTEVALLMADLPTTVADTSTGGRREHVDGPGVVVAVGLRSQKFGSVIAEYLGHIVHEVVMAEKGLPGGAAGVDEVNP